MVMEALENDGLKILQENHNCEPLCYHRYVDDKFLIFKKNFNLYHGRKKYRDGA